MKIDPIFHCRGRYIVIIKLATVISLWAGTTGAAFAIFDVPMPSVPEPSTSALLVAGALVAGGLRYLSKRKK
jgi:hypothetical protein